MLKKTITYTDYDGVERTEDFYFNLTRAELLEMELDVTGGMTKYIEYIIAAQDVSKLMRIFKEIILKAYGQKSPDGRRFIKSEEITNEFTQTEAFSNLYMELTNDAKKATDFINGIIPQQPQKMSVPNQ